MTSVPVSRAGVILAVADVERSLAFYRDLLGLAVEALYDEPPYATLAVAGTRLSLAEHETLVAAGAELVAPVFSPPWGGHRFFVRDPDGFLLEIEQPA